MERHKWVLVQVIVVINVAYGLSREVEDDSAQAVVERLVKEAKSPGQKRAENKVNEPQADSASKSQKERSHVCCKMSKLQMAELPDKEVPPIGMRKA